MSLKYLGVAALSVLIFASANTYADDITMQRSISFGKRVLVSEAVRRRCKLQTKIPHFIKAFSKKRGITINLTDENVRTMRGRVLVVTIIQSSSRGGGAWSGAKSLTISGRLKENGRTVARFTAGRYTGGGAFAAYKGTCSLLGRNAKRIGKDVALWLKDPQDGAHMGDATIFRGRY